MSKQGRREMYAHRSVLTPPLSPATILKSITHDIQVFNFKVKKIRPKLPVTQDFNHQ